MTWPLQSNRVAFYGNPMTPRGTLDTNWFDQNVIEIPTVWSMRMVGPVTHIHIHKKCADSLTRALHAIWNDLGQSQSAIAHWGLDVFSGSFNFRAIRGHASLSNHAFAAAVDFDAPDNPMGGHNGRLKHCQPFINAFKAEGWRLGMCYATREDDMHVEAVSG